MPKKPSKNVKQVQTCANIKNRKHPNERCKYPVKKGDFCSRHLKNPVRFDAPTTWKSPSTRSQHNAARKIQKIWRFKIGLKFASERSLAFFARDQCHNDSELATLEPLATVKRDYFFVVKESSKFWGFDIRTLLVQYEESGRLINTYTTQPCDAVTVEAFRRRLDSLRRWKCPLVFEHATNLSAKQSWNLRVLDVCLRLDMLGYRIATHWFSDLNIYDQKKLYQTLYNLWELELQLTEQQKQQIVPDYASVTNKLFKWNPDKIVSKNELDSVRRTNLNIIERLISSASEQSDKTLAAMYTVMALAKVSQRCRAAYPWLIEGN